MDFRPPSGGVELLIQILPLLGDVSIEPYHGLSILTATSSDRAFKWRVTQRLVGGLNAMTNVLFEKYSECLS